MQTIFMGITLGNDPHTVGIHKAGKIAKLAGIDYVILPPATQDADKIRQIKAENPRFIGLSYRLSPEVGLKELRKFLSLLEQSGLLAEPGRKLAFAALPETLRAVQNSGLQKQYGLALIGSQKNLQDNILTVLDFFEIRSDQKRAQIVKNLLDEAQPAKIPELDQLASRVIDTYADFSEPPLSKPSAAAINFLPRRMAESTIPLIRTHFGVPSDTIYPTLVGIEKIAASGAVDEISLGSSDLSQRYFGDPQAFKSHKNDGGVPYQTKDDLRQLFLATRQGNFPSIKPYAHVVNLKGFVDDCLETGMLIGAHQAVPLFWFCELDGRGPLSVDDALHEHIETVKYLASKHIPVEMNDPNQWSSRYVHDTLFVVDYALIGAVMFTAGVRHMILQCQFNKPVETGDFADLAKMSAAREIVEHIRPHNHPAAVYLESRAGIEHFSTDLAVAKFQLARTTLLQMILSPSMIHLVSYCEADHAATAEDVIESSLLVRKAVRLFQENAPDLIKYLDHPVVRERKAHLLSEAHFVTEKIAGLAPRQASENTNEELCRQLSNPEALFKALQNKIMTAPGITHPDYLNPSMLTKPNPYGFMDCYERWDDAFPLSEEQRLLERLNLND